eukprot:TRINITY_DN3634_c0_g2_i1.p1 TRINITY_DN3634_c0_g2~~TRINITY_DN3634_c0_g2_i1.p1  ORF type:complete len:340 (-),score=72.91 TRINITY_DN3634_c0_g2_i1:521-1540(-)
MVCAPYPAAGSRPEMDMARAAAEPVSKRFKSAATEEATSVRAKKGPLPDLMNRLADCGVRDRYLAWRDEYRRWRSGAPKGAHGEAEDAATIAASRATWRDQYRKWRQGFAHGAQGQPEEVALRAPSKLSGKCKQAPAVIFDVVVSEKNGGPALMPVDGPHVEPIPLENFPADALVTIRVFRFFEDASDHNQAWEQDLRNVNSGSLMWLPVHLQPGLHSVRGAKYGKWFTIHYMQAYVKHFSSGYHRAEEGSCYPAKTFGATGAETSTVSGKHLESGYFWYVHPAGTETNLQQVGWQHLCRAGPFDGAKFRQLWEEKGTPTDIRSLQSLLSDVTESFTTQ